MFLNFPSSSSILPLSDESNSNSAKATSVDKTGSSSKQLVEVASEQKHVNYHLCLFQYQLVRILYLTIRYNLKSVRPLSAIFDSKGNQALFSELHTHPLMSTDVDVKISNARKLVTE